MAFFQQEKYFHLEVISQIPLTTLNTQKFRLDQESNRHYKVFMR